MAIPPLLISFLSNKIFCNGEFILKKDYFQFNFLPIKYSIIKDLKGF